MVLLGAGGVVGISFGDIPLKSIARRRPRGEGVCTLSHTGSHSIWWVLLTKGEMEGVVDA